MWEQRVAVSKATQRKQGRMQMEATGRRMDLLALVDLPPPVLPIAYTFWVPPFLQLSCGFVGGGSGALHILQNIQTEISQIYI